MSSEDRMAQLIRIQSTLLYLHRMKRVAGAAAVLLIFNSACGIQQAPAPLALEESSLDLARYDTEVSFDLEAAALRARSVMRFVVDEHSAHSYSFRLSPTLQVQSVQGTGVRGFRTKSHEFRNEFIVELDDSVSPGSMMSLEVEYSGSPSFWENMVNEISPDWVQLGMDSGWHPEIAHVRFVTGILRVRLPADWAVVGSGTTGRENGLHIMRNTIPQPDASFAAGPALERIGSEEFTVYFGDERRDDVPVVLEAAEACSRYLNQHYGSEEPMPHVRLVLSPRSRSTFARKNFIPLSSLGGGTPQGIHHFLCHELAHFWAAPSSFDPADHWMSEAFAEYVAGMSVREHFGEEVFERWIAHKEERGREHGPVWTPEMTARVPDPTMYDRAPYLLSRLEERIGREQFERLVHQYMTERIGTTPELLERLEIAAGTEASEWFRQELAGKDASSS